MSRRAVLLTAILIPALFLGLSGCGKGPAPKTGKDAGAPGFTLLSLSGEKVSLSDFQGKVVVIDFWATWCPPCRQLIPNLVELHKRHSGKGLAIVGIALDREGIRVVEPFVRQARIPYPVLLGNQGVTEAYGRVESIPTLFIIDREGKVVRKLVGYHSFEELESQVSRYL